MKSRLLSAALLASAALAIPAAATETGGRCSLGGIYFDEGVLIRKGATVVECVAGNRWTPNTRTEAGCSHDGAAYAAGATISTTGDGSVQWSCTAGGAWQPV